MKSLLAITMLSLGVCIAGCGQQATQDVGEAIDTTGQTLSDAASDAGQAASDAMADAEQAAGDAADAVGQAASDTTAAAQDAGARTVEAAKVVADDAAAAAGDAKDKVAEGMAGVMDKAKSALEGVEGGPAMLTSVKEYFEKAKEALSGITDKESAEAAVNKLGDLSGSLQGVEDKMAVLPDQAKTALHSVIEKGRENLQALVEKYNDNPTIKEVIQPKIDEMMKRLSELTGKEQPATTE